MAKITLNNLSHSYVPDYTDADLVLRDINIDCQLFFSLLIMIIFEYFHMLL